MSSDAVVKTVAKKLKYYIDVKRLEDGFDLSGVNCPQLDHPPLKSRPTLQYDGLHDRALKHYFSLPEVRVRLTNMGPRRGEQEKSEGAKREDRIKKKIKTTMNKHDFKPSLYPEFVFVNTPGGRRVTSDVSGINALPRSRKFRHSQIKGGWPLLRSVPGNNVTPGEAQRLVNIATKLLVATETVDVIQPRPPSPKRGQSAPAPFETSKPLPGSESARSPPVTPVKQKQRPHTAKFTWDIHGRRHLTSTYKPKAYDDSYDSAYVTRSGSGSSSNHKRKRIVVKKVVKKKEAKAESETSHTHSSSDESSHESSHSESEEEPSKPEPATIKPRKERPKSPVYRSTVIHVPDTKVKDEVSVSHGTQAGDSVEIQTERFMIKDYDYMEDEVKQGKWAEYQIYVRTGNRIGASTKADVKLTIYGEKGRTKELPLKDSKRHKIKFQKGKEDLFILAGHHVGKLKKIKIGHDRTDLNSAWFLEGVTIYDMLDKRIYDINCERWLSGHDGDRRTYRVLDVDRDRGFIEALDDESDKEEENDSRKNSISSSDSSYTPREKSHTDKTSLQVKGSEKEVKYRDRHDSDSESDKSSYTTSSKTDSIDRTPRPLSPLKKEKDEFFDTPSGPTFIFRTETSKLASKEPPQSSSRPADVSMETSSTDHGSHSTEEFLTGYKVGLKAAEEEQKKKKEEEEKERRQILRGPSLHEAAGTGDLSRVEDLLQYYPDRKEDRNENGHTPLHVAADKGHSEIVKWLAVKNVDLNTETPTGYTAMHLAAMSGHVNCMMILYAMGASITLQTNDKKTPLYVAAQNGHLECVKWLVANGAQFDTEDDLGRTPLMVAEDWNRDEVAKFLKVCEDEAKDPQSSFAQMRLTNRPASGVLTPIQEDDATDQGGSSGKKANKGQGQFLKSLVDQPSTENISEQAYAGSDGEGHVRKSHHARDNELEIEEKKKLYEEQHHKMEESGDSFLDSIRHEFESRPEP